MKRRTKKKIVNEKNQKRKTVGFFHNERLAQPQKKITRNN
jgi:hypothetical protein